MPEPLKVYLNDTLLGTVAPSRTRPLSVTFTVDDGWSGASDDLTEGFQLVPGQTIDTLPTSNFFGGYVPEGEHRTMIAARARFDANDLFEWLKRYGLTMAGALSFRSDNPADTRPGTYRPLSNRDVIRKLEQEKRDFDLGNEPDSGRSMLPGFQPKLLAARFNGEWFYPENRAHSTHILKPPPARRPATIFDEFFSHELGRAMGLTTFGSELLTYNGHTFLSIERYDRVVTGDQVQLIHQEDAAQALGLDWVNSATKFQEPSAPNRTGRPSARKIAELFGSFGDGSDAETWLRYLIYGVLVGNHDGHAKNVSIIHDADGPHIAPMYDAVPILHINDDPSRVNEQRIPDAMALAIGGEFNHHSVTVDHFFDEVDSWGAFGSRRASLIIHQTLNRFGEALEAAPEVAGGSPGLKNRLGYNLDRLIAGKSIGKPKLPLDDWRAAS